MYIKTDGVNVLKYPYTIQALKADNPSTCFGAVPSQGDFASFGAFPVHATQPPVISTVEYIREGAPVQAAGGWFQVWEVLPKSEAQIQEEEEALKVQEVTPRQIRQALTKVGLRTKVEDAVAAADQDTKDWWEFTTVIARNNPQLIAMATLLDIPAVEVDAVFVLAASL